MTRIGIAAMRSSFFGREDYPLLAEFRELRVVDP